MPRQQQPRAQQEPPRQSPAQQQRQPQLEQSRQPQFQQQHSPQPEQSRQQPGQGVPGQVYRPAAPGASPQWTAGPPPRPGGPTATGRSYSGGPPTRDLRAGTYVYRGQASSPFRADRYRWHDGDHYQRYGIGRHFPLSLIIAAYVIADWTAYGLAPPLSGYEWVRYGPDILLVDPATGQIADAAYSAFAEDNDAEDPGNPPPAALPYQAQPGFAVQQGVPGMPQLLGSYGNWTAAVYQEAGQPVCYASTQAQTSAPQMAGPGALVLTVTQRPSGRDAVSIGGIVTDVASPDVTMHVDQAVLDFHTAGANAFARNGPAAVPVFQNGSQAIIQSVAPNNVPITYAFSLIGFSAAYAAITAACPLR